MPALTHSWTNVALKVAAADIAVTIRVDLPTSVSAMESVLHIDIWSDLVCPWCYIGKRRFERAVDRLTEGDSDVTRDRFEIRYRPFQLDPHAPHGVAIPVSEVYARKFGPQAPAIIERVTAVAAAEDLEFNLDRAWRANTFDAHRLLWWAESTDTGVDQGDLNDAIMRSYFTDGHDISNHAVLGDCAVDAGADRAEVERFLVSTDGSGEVDELIADAAQRGITAVPTYVIEDAWSIPGAQDVDVFEQVLRRMLDRSR